MKVGIIYLAFGVIGVGAIIGLNIIGGEVTLSVAGIGKMAVGGIISIYLILSGIARIRVARAKELLGKLGIDLETEEKGS